MNRKKCLKRTIFLFLLLVVSILSFSLSLHFLFPGLNGQLYFRITLLFSTFVTIGFSFSAFYVYRDYGKKENFLQEIRIFSDMVTQGTFEGRVFFKEYPDLAEIYSSLKDLTERLRVKFNQAEEERSRLNAMIQNIPDALIMIDNNNYITYANHTSGQFFGVTHLLNRSLFEVVRAPELTDLLEKVKDSLAGGSGELLIDYPAERYLNVKMAPFFYRGYDLFGIVILFQDITEVKKLESMRKDFVANVSHEIKTPVTAIRGFAETLLDGAIDDKDNALRFLTTIKLHSERLNRLVDDLMTISRIELGVIKLRKKEIDASETIDYVIDTLNSKASEKGLTLKKSLNHEDMFLTGDRDRTIQILLNLIDNAIKFTEKGGIEIGIDSDNRRYLFVKDTGIGIPFKYVESLGERFFRVDPSRSRELGGTGLGLAIVKHLAKAHGWEMKITSEEWYGTEVRIYLD